MNHDGHSGADARGSSYWGRVRSPEMLGDIVRQAREIQGLSQRQLGARLGIGQRWIWDLEQGKPGIFTTRLFRILDELGVRVLVEIDDTKTERHD
ncbi:MAG TPA: helix-turn-helix domain-containing protein [Miltoncostaeales bacterium]|jgi:HTH-type transcriptional regulator/antitoxin HipB|nr:helix-turn-helix domain-containing protein [Miltoncostaeales bacterium]